MFFRKKNQDDADQVAWVPAPGGIETTRSRKLIEEILSSLEKKRTTLMLMQKGSKSHPTLLLGSTGKYLLIDAPVEWKLKNLSVRIQFKSSANLDSYFDTKIAYLKDEIIYVKWPERLYRLQRRAHYRVEVPGGSQAVFAGQAGGGNRMVVKNISAGGMLCCSKSKWLECGTVLKDIDLLLTFASTTQGGTTNRINVPLGRIVRAFDDKATGHFCYGIAFECGNREENNLLAYIRQRERELAKAGVSS